MRGVSTTLIEYNLKSRQHKRIVKPFIQHLHPVLILSLQNFFQRA